MCEKVLYAIHTHTHTLRVSAENENSAFTSSHTHTFVSNIAKRPNGERKNRHKIKYKIFLLSVVGIWNSRKLENDRTNHTE